VQITAELKKSEVRSPEESAKSEKRVKTEASGQQLQIFFNNLQQTFNNIPRIIHGRWIENCF